VGGADLGTDAGLVSRHHGEEKPDGVDAEFEEPRGDFLGEGGVADHDGHDGVRAGLEGESSGFQAGAVVAGVGFEFVAEFGGRGEQFQRGEGAGGDGGREGIGKEIRTGALAEEVDNFLASADVTAAGAAEGFAEGAGVDVDAVLDAAVLGSATAGGAHEADRVAVVDHDEGLVFFGEVTDFAERSDEAVHRKYAVGDDEFEARASGIGGLKLFFEVVEVAVGVAEALSFAETHAVDDGGVVEGVTDDGVLGGEEGFEHAAVGVETGGEEDRVFGAEEGGEGLLEFAVHPLGAADEAHRGGTVAPALERGVASGDEIGVVTETEVVVGAEVEHLATVFERDAGALGGADDAFAFVEAVGFDRGEGGLQVLAVSGSHGVGGGESADKETGSTEEARR